MPRSRSFLRPAAHETRDTGGVPDHEPGVRIQDHLDQDVAGVDLLLDGDPLPAADLDLVLLRHQRLEDLVLHAHRLDAVSRLVLTFFSYPEYVWMTYQRFSGPFWVMCSRKSLIMASPS